MSKETKKIASVEAAKIALISAVIMAVFGAITAAINAYADYKSNREQIELPIFATQTAEARLTKSTPAASTPSLTRLTAVSPAPTLASSTVTATPLSPLATETRIPTINELTLEITWVSPAQVTAISRWTNLPPKDNLYLMTFAFNRYFAPILISESSGERNITINSGITEIAIVEMTGATTMGFPASGVEVGDPNIIIHVLIQKPIPPKK